MSPYSIADSNTWVPGPDLPEPHWGGSIVQLDDTFLAVGGEDALYLTRDFVIKYVPDDNSFLTLNETLFYENSHHCAVRLL